MMTITDWRRTTTTTTTSRLETHIHYPLHITQTESHKWRKSSTQHLSTWTEGRERRNAMCDMYGWSHSSILRTMEHGTLSIIVINLINGVWEESWFWCFAIWDTEWNEWQYVESAMLLLSWCCLLAYGVILQLTGNYKCHALSNYQSVVKVNDTAQTHALKGWFDGSPVISMMFRTFWLWWFSIYG